MKVILVVVVCCCLLVGCSESKTDDALNDAIEKTKVKQSDHTTKSQPADLSQDNREQQHDYSTLNVADLQVADILKEMQADDSPNQDDGTWTKLDGFYFIHSSNGVLKKNLKDLYHTELAIKMKENNEKKEKYLQDKLAIIAEFSSQENEENYEKSKEKYNDLIQYLIESIEAYTQSEELPVYEGTQIEAIGQLDFATHFLANNELKSQVRQNIQNEFFLFNKDSKNKLQKLNSNSAEIHFSHGDNIQVFQVDTIQYDNKKEFSSKFTEQNIELVKSSHRTNKHVFLIDSNLFSLDTTTFKLVQITPNTLTSDTCEQFSKEDFEEKLEYITWVRYPEINPAGDTLLYYTNRDLNDGEMDLQHNIILNFFDSKSEETVIKEKDLGSGFMLSPKNISWLDSDTFMYEVKNKSSEKIIYYKFNIKEKTSEKIVELDHFAYVENGFMLHQDQNSVHVISALHGETKKYALADVNVNFAAISKDGNVAIPKNNSIIILNRNNNAIESFDIPETSRSIKLDGWLDQTHLLIHNINENGKRSWILEWGK
ncbi:hypothetical protein [Longirhabdus pacifica]|uniref:hypothetical protein n=1 Tax=Longirhabdus pacifica TaxID=2305227 RepID=UPI001008F8FA|nr:hypothetical protein [Longirhabdus pacifica]